jgi:hypothetical protein
MELTITQSGALYLASRRIAKPRSTFFRRARKIAGQQTADVRPNLHASETLAIGRFRAENGR